MLEILAVRWLVGHVGGILAPKNQPGCRYQALAVLLWFIGEFIGLGVGVLLIGDISLAAYLLACLGALAGAAIAIAIANNLPTRAPADAPNRSST